MIVDRATEHHEDVINNHDNSEILMLRIDDEIMMHDNEEDNDMKLEVDDDDDDDTDTHIDDLYRPNRGWGRGIVQDFRSTVMVSSFFW